MSLIWIWTKILAKKTEESYKASICRKTESRTRLFNKRLNSFETVLLQEKAKTLTNKLFLVGIRTCNVITIIPKSNFLYNSKRNSFNCSYSRHQQAVNDTTKNAHRPEKAAFLKLSETCLIFFNVLNKACCQLANVTNHDLWFIWESKNGIFHSVVFFAKNFQK